MRSWQHRPPITPVDPTKLRTTRWLTAALDLEEVGLKITGVAMAPRLRVGPKPAIRVLEFLKDNHLVNEARVTGRGRWHLSIPVLCYVATSLDPLDPHVSAAQSVAAAVDITTAIGHPMTAMMPSTVTLAKAAQGDENALDALVGFAQRADVVLVLGDDPILEERFDVIAAQRADVLVVVAREDDPAAALRGALTYETTSIDDFWRSIRLEYRQKP